MEPLPKSASDAAGEILRLIFERRATTERTRIEFTFDSYLEDRCARWRRRDTVKPVHPYVPIRRFHQSVFAAVFRQALVEGLAVVDAVELAARVNPSRTLRQALAVMSDRLRAGYPLSGSLAASRAWVDRGLLAALDVGDEYGDLADELKAFVQHDRFFSAARFRRAIGRRPESVRFAAALARLLHEHHLTGPLVCAAGRVSGTRGGRFMRMVKTVSANIDGGNSLAECLKRHPAYFDAVFCRFVELPQSREDMRARLERLVLAGELS
ncbi:MAG: type II secretion system F family protein [Isosphaeraceae bacterium]|nr:type II secretion system F family protein [Isosphaeraceae bacterium]